MSANATNLVYLLILCLANYTESQCGDWVSFRDKKCFKIVESSGLQTYADAIKTCLQQSNDSNLVTINSADEQSFLATMIFTTNQIVDNVWIGAKKFDNSHYQWLNGLNFTYTNWAEGYPKNLTDNCVELNYESVGKWTDTPCNKKKLVVCELLQNWSTKYTQEVILSLLENNYNLKTSLERTQKELEITKTELKKTITQLTVTNNNLEDLTFSQDISNQLLESFKFNVNDTLVKFDLIHKQTEVSLMDKVTTLEKSDLIHKQTEASLVDKVSTLEKSEVSLVDKVSTLEKSESSLQETISNLKQNVIPIGFIYVQFPHEKTPHEIWSWITWNEITSSYAGLFFRAFGGNSSSFGSTQEDNSPTINKVRLFYYKDKITDVTQSSKDLKADEWLWTGVPKGAICDFKFLVSSGEVRPRNTAIRIWKRQA